MFSQVSNATSVFWCIILAPTNTQFMLFHIMYQLFSFWKPEPVLQSKHLLSLQDKMRLKWTDPKLFVFANQKGIRWRHRAQCLIDRWEVLILSFMCTISKNLPRAFIIASARCSFRLRELYIKKLGRNSCSPIYGYWTLDLWNSLQPYPVLMHLIKYLRVTQVKTPYGRWLVEWQNSLVTLIS